MAAMTYTCKECGPTRIYSKEELTVKRVQFRVMGQGGRVLKTRVIAWLCHDHRDADPDFHRASYEDAPGTAAKRDHGVTID